MAAVLKTLAPALAALPLAACAGSPPPPPPPPAPPGLPGLHVVLTWSAPVDLDLYVTDPSSETVYFGHTPSRSGMVIAGDERCSPPRATRPRAEHVRAATPAPGRYRVGVDFIDDCGSGLREAPFRVTAFAHDHRLEVAGVARRERFAPVVLEFDLVPGGATTPLLPAPSGGP